MTEPSVGLAFILLQTAPGPEAPFEHGMCLPASSSYMQSITIKEMGMLFMFPATLPFHFLVHYVPIQPHRLLSTDTIRSQNVSRGNDKSAQADDAANDEECPKSPGEVRLLPCRTSL